MFAWTTTFALLLAIFSIGFPSGSLLTRFAPHATALAVAAPAAAWAVLGPAGLARHLAGVTATAPVVVWLIAVLQGTSSIMIGGVGVMIAGQTLAMFPVLFLMKCLGYRLDARWVPLP